MRLPGALLSLLLAAGLVLGAFPEVVFLGGSLSPTGLNDVVDRGADPREVSVYPNAGRSPRWGARDIGAAAWQLEPATKFMHRALSEGESPYWNPYSAAGSLGPETLVDMKLSPFVLLVAVLGASAAAFTFVMLSFLVVALYCLQQFFIKTLSVGRLAATSACVVFLLSGFATSDLTSNVGAPYVLFPVVLYTLAEYHRVGHTSRFAVAVAAYAALIATTFLPVSVLMLLLAHGVTLLLDGSRPKVPETPQPRSVTRLVTRQAAVPVVALLATAYVWLPMVDGLRQGGSDIASYTTRTLTTMDALDMLGILTPGARYLGAEAGDWIMYLGIVPTVLLAAAWPQSRGLQRRLLSLTVVVVLVALTQYAGVPVIKAIGELPGLRVIRGDYWGSLAAASLTLAVGVAVATVASRGLSLRGAFIASSVCAAVLIIGLAGSTDASNVAILSIVAGLGLALAVIALAFMGTRIPTPRRRMLAAGALALLAFELLSYQTHARVQRFDLDDPPPRYVAFLRQHIGDARILNAGRGGIYPEWGAALGIPQIETINTTQLPHYRDFFFRYITPDQNRGLFLQIGSDEDARFTADPSALDLLSVRYIVVDEAMARFDQGARAKYPLAFVDHKAGIRVYENPNAFPRAYLSPALTEGGTPDASPAWSRATTRSDDPSLIDAALKAAIPSRATRIGTLGTARVSVSRHDEVRVEVDAARPAVLVLTDSYHDNWNVSVAGEAEPLARVNDIARGVVVPPGRSTVVFEYRSPSRVYGGVVSVVTIAVVLIAGAGRAWFRRFRSENATVRDHANAERDEHIAEKVKGG